MPAAALDAVQLRQAVKPEVNNSWMSRLRRNLQQLKVTILDSKEPIAAQEIFRATRTMTADDRAGYLSCEGCCKSFFRHAASATCSRRRSALRRFLSTISSCCCASSSADLWTWLWYSTRPAHSPSSAYKLPQSQSGLDPTPLLYSRAPLLPADHTPHVLQVHASATHP